jgi:hypothetical protein
LVSKGSRIGRPVLFDDLEFQLGPDANLIELKRYRHRCKSYVATTFENVSPERRPHSPLSLTKCDLGGARLRLCSKLRYFSIIDCLRLVPNALARATTAAAKP